MHFENQALRSVSRTKHEAFSSTFAMKVITIDFFLLESSDVFLLTFNEIDRLPVSQDQNFMRAVNIGQQQTRIEYHGRYEDRI